MMLAQRRAVAIGSEKSYSDGQRILKGEFPILCNSRLALKGRETFSEKMTWYESL